MPSGFPYALLLRGDPAWQGRGDKAVSRRCSTSVLSDFDDFLRTPSLPAGPTFPSRKCPQPLHGHPAPLSLIPLSDFSEGPRRCRAGPSSLEPRVRAWVGGGEAVAPEFPSPPSPPHPLLQTHPLPHTSSRTPAEVSQGAPPVAPAPPQFGELQFLFIPF